jgi:hypothetical protein
MNDITEDDRELLELLADVVRNLRDDSRRSLRNFLLSDAAGHGGALVVRGRYQRAKRHLPEAGYVTEQWQIIHGTEP